MRVFVLTILLVGLVACRQEVGSQGGDFLYASRMDGSIVKVYFASSSDQLVANTGLDLFDMALDGQDTIYLIARSGHALYRYGMKEQRLVRLQTQSLPFINALTVGPDGKLYGAGEQGVYEVDVLRGTYTRIASLPCSSSGDLVLDGQGGILIVLSCSLMGDSLYRIGLDGGNSVKLLDFPEREVYGLSWHGQNLYALSSRGALYRVNLNTREANWVRVLGSGTYTGM